MWTMSFIYREKVLINDMYFKSFNNQLHENEIKMLYNKELWL